MKFMFLALVLEFDFFCDAILLYFYFGRNLILGFLFILFFFNEISIFILLFIFY